MAKIPNDEEFPAECDLSLLLTLCPHVPVDTNACVHKVDDLWLIKYIAARARWRFPDAGEVWRSRAVK